MKEIDFPKPRKHIFVCVNDKPVRKDGIKPNCCAKFISVEEFKEIKLELVKSGKSREIYLTRTGCLGFCNPNGFVVCVYPDQKFYIIESKKELLEFILNI